MLYILLLCLFLTSVAFFRLAYVVFYADKKQARARLLEQTALLKEEILVRDEEELPTTWQNRLSHLFLTTPLYRRLQQLIAQSYIRITPEELVKLSFIAGAGLALLSLLAETGALGMLAAFLLGMGLPFYNLLLIGRQRARQLNKQLPQALAILANGLRAGFSFMQSMNIVANEMEAPISDEFNKILRDSQLGKPVDEALLDFEERTANEDISFLVSALLIQMQVGGDMAEILDIIGNTIRERTQLYGQIKTLTSQSRFSALIIGLLPIALAVILYMANTEYMSVLFTEPLGLIMVAGAAALIVLGMLVLYKIVNIKV